MQTLGPLWLQLRVNGGRRDTVQALSSALNAQESMVAETTR